MARLERPQAQNSNPATKFLSWNSTKKKFHYYDKSIEKNIEIDIPLRFLFLEHYHTVKGWHDPTTKGIYSNEVYAFGNEPLSVKTFGGISIADGFYKDIKDKVKLSGGVYIRSVYVMLEDGSIANLQLKGSAVGGLKPENSLKKIEIPGYSDFYNKNKHLLDNQFIEINSIEEAKKGATVYSIPVFSVGRTITDNENIMANECAKILQKYIVEYKNGKTSVSEKIKEEVEESENTDVDELDF